MNWENKYFIKPDIEFDSSNPQYAPLFRKIFTIDKTYKKATVKVCGLGYAYYYLNGQLITSDLFTAPFSNYDKTLWYNSYDITDMLRQGKNVFAVSCGNGWYNEAIPTAWDFNEAKWRDLPKFYLCLELDDVVVLKTDSSWKCTMNSPVIYNQLRVGENFDARLYDEKWNQMAYDDSNWQYAKEDDKPPKGVLRECECEPIREFEEYAPQSIVELGDRHHLFDFGVNISGYARLKIKQRVGDTIILRYGERIDGNNKLTLEGICRPKFYPQGVFQTDQFICDGKEHIWYPKFTYHGFRYVEAEGLETANKDTLTAVFVHQAVEERAMFRCSNANLNKLFEIGQRATLSNLFYMPTDCPTREKMGWMNDAQASANQMITDFTAEKVLKKWWYDISDAFTEEGGLPGIVPTPGWGYDWGNGPVSEGTLYEIPYQIYVHTNDSSLLLEGLPFFEKHLQYLNSKKDADGEISYGLDDWTAPDSNNKVPSKFINSVLKIKFLQITLLAAKLADKDTASIIQELNSDVREVKKRYILSDGTCRLDKQTAVAMLIYYGIYDTLKPLKKQLKDLVEKADFHHDCGMVGLRHLYTALNICDLQEYAYRIITVKGYPSYMDWLEDGATALYESWSGNDSRNHHMYSDFMAWMIETILGICPKQSGPGYTKVTLSPYFIKELDFAEGYCNTVSGRIAVKWSREQGKIKIEFDIAEGVEAYYKNRKLDAGRTIVYES